MQNSAFHANRFLSVSVSTFIVFWRLWEPVFWFHTRPTLPLQHFGSPLGIYFCASGPPLKSTGEAGWIRGGKRKGPFFIFFCWEGRRDCPRTGLGPSLLPFWNLALFRSYSKSCLVSFSRIVCFLSFLCCFRLLFLVVVGVGGAWILLLLGLLGSASSCFVSFNLRRGRAAPQARPKTT